MNGIGSIWRRVRLIAWITLTVAAASGPPLTPDVQRIQLDRPDPVARSARLGKPAGIRASRRAPRVTWGPGARVMGEEFP